jgi:lipoprotein NlpD
VGARGVPVLALAWALAAGLGSACATRRPIFDQRRARPAPVRHEVERGDTLSGIARRYGTTVDAIVAANALENPNALSIGQVLLVLPGAGGVAEPAPADPGGEPRPPAPGPVDGRPPPRPDPKAPGPLVASPESGRTKWIWPVDGVVIDQFGRRDGARFDGITIAAPLGTAVWAAADGEVLYAGEQAGYGSLVILGHSGGVVTLYGRADKLLVREGQKVRQGEPVALVGQSGGAPAPGLHFEMRVGSDPIDPLPKLP